MRYPQPTRVQISLIAKFGIGGNFNAAMAGLLGAGLVTYPGGGRVALTEAGKLRARAEETGVGRGQAAYLERVYSRLPTNDSRLLRVLVDHYPDAITRQELSAEAGIGVGGNFDHSISRLLKLELVHYPGPGMVAAEAVLFP